MIKDGIEIRITKYKCKWRHFRFKRDGIVACLTEDELKAFDADFGLSSQKESDAVFEKLLSSLPLEPDTRTFWEKYPPLSLFLAGMFLSAFAGPIIYRLGTILFTKPEWFLDAGHVLLILVVGISLYYAFKYYTEKMFYR